MTVVSYLEFDKTFPEENKKKLLLPNGLAMTYSLARGIISEMTSQSLNGRYLLPTINFIEVIKQSLVRKKRKLASLKKKLKK
jgi:preprotein translocase subunit SecB